MPFVPALLLAAACAAPTSYVVTPVAVDGRLHHLAVALRIRGDADGETRLRLPDEWAGTGGLWRGVGDVAVEGASSVAADGDARRVLRHAPGARLVVRYDVRPLADSAAEPGAGFEKARPVVRPGWFFFHGEGVFAVPEARGDERAAFAWGPLPAGWRVASDLDHLSACRGAVRDVVESVAIGAPDLRVVTRRVDGAPVRLAIRGAWRATDSTLADQVTAVVRGAHQAWRERVRPFVVVVAPLATDTTGRMDVYGTGRTDGFSLAATTNANLPAQRRFLTHEMLHRWVPGAIGGLAPDADARAEAADYWLSEGFTDWLAARTLRSAGLWTDAERAADLDSVLWHAATSPAHRLPDDAVAARFWSDPDVAKVPYERGHLVALRLDAELRARTAGRRGLDDVLRRMAADARRDEARGVTISAARRLPAAVRAVTGVDIAELLDRHVARGEAVRLPPDALGPCLTIETVTGPVFDRGFDLRATQAGGMVIAGVDTLGPAWAAGMRDGMRLVKREAGTPGDPTVAYAYRVRDGEAERVLRYLPASARPVTRQRVAAVRCASAGRPRA